MQYGICNLSNIPLRLEATDTSEMVSQVLYGEVFKVLEQRKSWHKIRLAFDKYEGWIDHKQYAEITKDNYDSIRNTQPILSADLVEFISTQDNQLFPISIGASLNALELLSHSFDGVKTDTKQPKDEIVTTAFSY